MSAIYSRYTGGRRVVRPEPTKNLKQNIQEKSTEGNEEYISSFENGSCRRILPNAPPNYRGMIYDMAEAEWTPEGIERIALNDCNAFCGNKGDRGGNKKAFDDKRKNKPPFSHMSPPPASACECKGGSDAQSGIKNIIEGMKNKSFQPEDVLICAMIMLMLNGKSEDDLLLVLVLMMLL